MVAILRRVDKRGMTPRARFRLGRGAVMDSAMQTIFHRNVKIILFALCAFGRERTHREEGLNPDGLDYLRTWLDTGFSQCFLIFGHGRMVAILKKRLEITW